MSTLKFSLRAKLFAAFFFLSAIITIAITYVLFIHMRTDHMNTLKRELEVAGKMAAMYVAEETKYELNGLLEEGISDNRLQSLLQAIGQKSDEIAKVLLLRKSPDNEMVVGNEWDNKNLVNRQPGISHSIPEHIYEDNGRALVTENIETGTVTAYTPVIVNGKTVAWLALEVDAAAVANDTRHFAERVFIVALGAIIFIGICSWFLAGNFTVRIQLLEQAINQIAAGRLTTRLMVKGNDEVSILAARINNLATTLHSEKESLMMSTIESLVTALEAKDAYTYGHSSQVAWLAEAIGRSLGLREDELFTLRIAALLHDIGKIGIPDNILNKPGQLENWERDIIMQHPETGAKIISGIPALCEVAKIVSYHHERWDGGGYPSALSCENIPLGARIIAVADTYQAMVSDRPYRKGMPEKHAFNEIIRCAGTQFDPTVVDAFAKAIFSIIKG